MWRDARSGAGARCVACHHRGPSVASSSGVRLGRVRDRARHAADTPGRLLGAHPADIVPTLALLPQDAHVLCIVDYGAAQSQMQTLRAVGLKRLSAMDWIGATAATEDATISAALHPAEVNTLTIAGWLMGWFDKCLSREVAARAGTHNRASRVAESAGPLGARKSGEPRTGGGAVLAGGAAARSAARGLACVESRLAQSE
jgi:hypothetical protein